MSLYKQTTKIEAICLQCFEFRKGKFDKYLKMNPKKMNNETKLYYNYIIQQCEANGVNTKAVLRIMFND